MEKQFKVVRVDRISGPLATMVEEAEELAKVNAELVEVACVTEDEVTEAAKDKCRTGGSQGSQRAVAQECGK